MGLGIGIRGRSSSTYDKSTGNTTIIERVIARPVEKTLPNPDPYNWIIKDSWKNGKYLLVDITYPDCTNYEGRKIMLYEGVTLEELKEQRTIDPHFSSNKRYFSPIARFEPTFEGWEMGQKLVNELVKG